MKYLSILLVSLLVSPAVTAIDTSGNYAVWGVGKKACFHYNKARASNNDVAYTSYIKGFLTAFNITEPETYNISGTMKFQEILDWIDDSCELKQVHSLEQTLLEFIEAHYESRSQRSRSRSSW
ncbi:MAG: hypothetical protein R3318_02620 [Gammaproteobacteria bacterium]|nr:hypothetical protein [Gammaproteobacteria bacterium]